MRMIETDEYGPIDVETRTLYDRLVRQIGVALDVYLDAEKRARAEHIEAGEFDLPAGPAKSIEIDAVIGLAVDMLKNAGDERTAWLLVEVKALRGGPPARLMEAIIALHTLHRGAPPPLAETARKAAGGPDRPAGVDLAAWLARRDARTPTWIVSAIIEPMDPYRPGPEGGDS